MEDIEKTEKTHDYEKQDSIEVSRNQKGIHSFKLKRYFSWESDGAAQVIQEMKKTEELLLKAFSGKNE